MRKQEPYTYLPCLSRSVPGCVAVLVNIGDGEVEWVRVRIPLMEAGPGSRTVTYQLGRLVDKIGACRGLAWSCLDLSVGYRAGLLP
jgi:hypothetical protein